MISLPNLSGYVSAFSPYCRVAGIPLVDQEPVAHNGSLYFEVLGTDLWLAQSVVSGMFFVANSEGEKMSQDFWNPAYAVEKFLILRELEENGVI